MDRKITKIEPVSALLARRKVTGYARVSCAKDEMLHSLAAQVSYYSELIQCRPDWTYTGVYADAAETGTKDNRPEFQRMLADCRAGRVDYIITKSISRFARNTVTLLEVVRELKELGIGVYFEEQNIDTLSSEGELLLTILASYAQEESRSVSENCKWRIRRDFREGKLTCNIRIYGYHYKDRVFTIIPEEAAVVRMIFADYLSGMGKNAIMKKLIRLEIPTKCGGGWTENTVSSILRDEKYLGDLRLQKRYAVDHLSKRYKKNEGELEQFYVEGNHEGIVDRATFDAVQVELARRAAHANRVNARNTSDFTGMIHCGRCGANFRRKINAIGTKYVKPLWACSTYTNRGKRECAAKRIPEDILKRKCAEVLRLDQFDSEVIHEQVISIDVPSDGVLVFTLADQSTRTVSWENRPRSDSWTEEMKQSARSRVMKGGELNG